MIKKQILLFAVVVATIFALEGCSSFQTKKSASSLRFDYQAVNREPTGLIRAFDDGERTILQFTDIGSVNPKIYSGDGSELSYGRVGQYAVLPGLYPVVMVRVGGQVSEVRSTRPGAIIVNREPVQTVHGQPDVAIHASPSIELSADQSLAEELRVAHSQLERAQNELNRLKILLNEEQNIQTNTLLDESQITGDLDRIEANIMNIATTVYQVQFGYGRTNFALPDEIKDTLIAAAISARRINLRGRTDSKIADEANKRVAIERAFAARRFLITNGVDPHRIRLYALAAGDFIAPNSTKEGRAKNRRVEIELIDVGAYPAAMAKRYTKN